jgi:hypothetical protein
VSFLERQAIFCLWSKDAWCEVLGKCRGVGVIRSCKLNEAGEMGGDGVESCDVGESELA